MELVGFVWGRSLNIKFMGIYELNKKIKEYNLLNGSYEDLCTLENDIANFVKRKAYIVAFRPLPVTHEAYSSHDSYLATRSTSYIAGGETYKGYFYKRGGNYYLQDYLESNLNPANFSIRIITLDPLDYGRTWVVKKLPGK